MIEQNIPTPTPNPKKNIHLAMAAYPIFFVPFLSKEKDDPFVKFHTHQGIGLFVIVFALQFVLQAILPFLIMMFSFVLMPIIILMQIAIIALVVIGMKNAYHGLTKPLPYIGEHIESFFKK